MRFISSYTKLKNYMSENKGLTYILKPDVGSKGEKIYLTKSLQKFDRCEKSICQVYISKVNFYYLYYESSAIKFSSRKMFI